MELLNKAKQLLKEQGYTFVAIGEHLEYTSTFKGIRPIMEKMKENEHFFQGSYIADKVIGKSAAMLLIHSGVKEVYGEVLSEHAKASLEEAKVPYSYTTLVPYIINNSKDGMCPMEATVLDISDGKRAFIALQNKLKELQQNK